MVTESTRSQVNFNIERSPFFLLEFFVECPSRTCFIPWQTSISKKESKWFWIEKNAKLSSLLEQHRGRHSPFNVLLRNKRRRNNMGISYCRSTRRGHYAPVSYYSSCKPPKIDAIVIVHGSIVVIVALPSLSPSRTMTDMDALAQNVPTHFHNK